MILTTIQVIICRRKLCDVRLWWCYDDHVNELELGQIFGIKYCYILKKFKVFRFDLVLTVKAFPNITSWGFQLSWAKYPAGFFFYLFSFLIITKKKIVSLLEMIDSHLLLPQHDFVLGKLTTYTHSQYNDVYRQCHS